MQNLIEIKNVTKSYRRDSIEVPVLNNIDLNVPDGEFPRADGPFRIGQNDFAELDRRNR